MSWPEWTSPDGSVRLVNADCRELLRSLEPGSVDAVVSDPPYGIDYENAGGFSEQCGWVRHEKLGWDKTRPTKECFDLARSLSRVQVFWGGNYFADMLPAAMRWLIWDKWQTGFTLADCEMAWTSQNNATRRLLLPRAIANKEPRLHCTQKPVALMEWTMEICCEPEDLICDPFLGSGTTAVACMRTGRKCIGIEIEPKYFAIAVERCQRELARQPLFRETAKQQEMF